MKPETKLAVRWWTIRKRRLLFDFLDDRLHAAEVRLRDELAGQRAGHAGETRSQGESRGSLPEKSADVPAVRLAHRETFTEWEARRSGVAPVSKKAARRRGMPAHAFDLRFSTR